MPRSPGPALLFDLDGTLADTLEDIRASANHVRAAAGLPAMDRATTRRMIGDGARNLVARAVADNRAGLDPDAALELFRAHHEGQCTRTVELFDGVAESLQAWHAEGHPMAVVTNKPERYAAEIVRHLGLARWLEVVVGGDTLAVRKPDPEPIFEALRRLDASPETAVMIGDGEQDVRAGKAAGVRTIAVLYGYRDEAALRAEGADAHWSCFAETHPASR